MKNYGFDIKPGEVLFETDLHSPAQLQRWFEIAKTFRGDLEFVLGTSNEQVSLILIKDPKVNDPKTTDNVQCLVSQITSSKTDSTLSSNKMRNIAYNHVAEIFSNNTVNLQCRDGINGIFTSEGFPASIQPQHPDNFLIGLAKDFARYSKPETLEQKRHFTANLWRPDQMGKFVPTLELYPQGYVAIDLQTHTGTSDERLMSFLINNELDSRGQPRLSLVGIKYPFLGAIGQNGRDKFSKAGYALMSMFTKKNKQGTPVVLTGYDHVEDRHKLADYEAMECPLLVGQNYSMGEFLMNSSRNKDEIRKRLLQGAFSSK